MENSTLAEILRKFNKEEFKELEDLVKSPYYNKNSNIVSFFAMLKRFYPDFTGNLSRETLWKYLFPDRKYNYGVMKNLIFGLQKLCEKFIELKEYEKNHFEQKISLSEGLIARDLASLFEKNLKRLQYDISKSRIDENYYYYSFMAESKEQVYFYHFSKTKDPDFCNPMRASESLSSFFLMRFFGSNYNALLNCVLYNKSFDTRYIRSAMQFFEESLSKDNDAVKIYYYSIMTLLNIEDSSSFYMLKEIVQKHIKDFDVSLSFNGCMSLVNFCNLNSMKGNLNFAREQFEIYKFMIDNCLFHGEDEKFIDRGMFVNIVSSGSNAAEFEWTEKFIEKYGGRVHPDFRNQYITLANVILNIKKKKFETALSHLANAESKEFLDKVNIRRFQIMIYYELNYIDELYSFIDASKHFLSNNNRISDSVKSAFQNFILLVLKLVSLKSKPKSKNTLYDLQSFRKEIELSDSPNKMWLLEKVAELESR